MKKRAFLLKNGLIGSGWGPKMDPSTIYVCGKCGVHEELHAAKASGWRIENRRGGRHGLTILCPRCLKEGVWS
jgi:hypothetical protein